MSSKQGYGAYVSTEDVSGPLESTRLQRLALNVLWNELPPGTNTEPVHDALLSIHNRITEIETCELRRCGAAEHYLIIRPVSPPPPEIMEKITAAVRALTELGMVVGQHDAHYRE